MDAVTDPGWWRYHSNWVAIFHSSFRFRSWRGLAVLRARAAHTICVHLLLQIALQYVLAHRAIEGDLRLV
jgi:hypothetical protein